jgi:hypothetical protein
VWCRGALSQGTGITVHTSVGLPKVRADTVTQPKAYTVMTDPTLCPHLWTIAYFHLTNPPTDRGINLFLAEIH